MTYCECDSAWTRAGIYMIKTLSQIIHGEVKDLVERTERLHIHTARLQTRADRKYRKCTHLSQFELPSLIG